MSAALPIPEVRAMVVAVRRYIDGDGHFSALVAPIERCVWWARVYNAHPAVQRLANDWLRWVDETWNEHGQHATALPEEELRRRLAADLACGPFPR